MDQTSFMLSYCMAQNGGTRRKRAGTQMHTARSDTSLKAPRREPAALHLLLAGQQKHHHSLQQLKALLSLLGQMSNTERFYLRPPKHRKIRERAKHKHAMPKQQHQLNERSWEAHLHLAIGSALPQELYSLPHLIAAFPSSMVIPGIIASWRNEIKRCQEQRQNS